MMGKEKYTIQMKLNGSPVSIEIEPDEMLAHVLREKFGLTGTNISCGEGECGACTVLVNGVPVTSCIYPAIKAHHREVLTIEGLADGNTLHPIQEAFASHAAAQCGFCTPGFIMTAKALLDKNPDPNREEIKLAVSGNLCRCTGYYQIIDAIEDAACRMRGDGGE